jgi:cytochrome c oxidase subunit III
MSEQRTVLDVSATPKTVFGHRSLMWWGTLAFMVIEGFTLVLMAASYLYLRQNEYDWPPGRTPDPDLLIPTINTVLLLSMMVPMYMAQKAAVRFDRAGVVRGMVAATALSLIVLVLRWFELLALNARWDTNAYASAAWAVVVLHGTLVLTDFGESATLTALFLSRRAQNKHYPDICDAALYQYYLSLSWVPLYLLIYWAPRWM